MRMKTILLSILSISIISCSTTTSEDQTTSVDSLYQQATEIAQKYIITDGHVDLPYRLNKEMEDVSIRTTNGDFDYERAKEGGLDAPFMSIYVPASYQETGGAKAFADSMITIVKDLTDQ